jgi:hypothetical protein
MFRKREERKQRTVVQPTRSEGAATVLYEFASLLVFSSSPIFHPFAKVFWRSYSGEEEEDLIRRPRREEEEEEEEMTMPKRRWTLDWRDWKKWKWWCIAAAKVDDQLSAEQAGGDVWRWSR